MQLNEELSNILAFVHVRVAKTLRIYSKDSIWRGDLREKVYQIHIYLFKPLSNERGFHYTEMLSALHKKPFFSLIVQFFHNKRLQKGQTLWAKF